MLTTEGASPRRRQHPELPFTLSFHSIYKWTQSKASTFHPWRFLKLSSLLPPVSVILVYTLKHYVLPLPLPPTSSSLIPLSVWIPATWPWDTHLHCADFMDTTYTSPMDFTPWHPCPSHANRDFHLSSSSIISRTCLYSSCLQSPPWTTPTFHSRLSSCNQGSPYWL